MGVDIFFQAVPALKRMLSLRRAILRPRTPPPGCHERSLQLLAVMSQMTSTQIQRSQILTIQTLRSQIKINRSLLSHACYPARQKKPPGRWWKAPSTTAAAAIVMDPATYQEAINSSRIPASGSKPWMRRSSPCVPTGHGLLSPLPPQSSPFQ